ncbi:MAG: hypothetical protein Q9183_002600, partial [Haloplaca sp. 2 TL-2023]
MQPLSFPSPSPAAQHSTTTDHGSPLAGCNNDPKFDDIGFQKPHTIQIIASQRRAPCGTMNSPSSTDLSSDLSSIGSLSPPPPSPAGYPSPPSSQNYNPDDSTSHQACRKRSRTPEGQEPTKKRRKAEPRPRTTQHLDLRSTSEPLGLDQTSQLDALSKVLQRRKKIVVIAGAGISVSAGIPDFRSASGLFSTLKNDHNLKASGKQLFDASVYQTDSATTSFHSMVRGLSQLASQAKPTAFHHLLATLGEQGRLMRLYTQNVDGIDTSLTPLATSVPLANKGPWPRTIQLHGGLEKMVCSKCNHLSDFQPALFDGPHPPPCTQCVVADEVRTNQAGKRSHGIGRLRPRIVLYNEANPDDEAIGTVVSSDLRARPDAVIVVGTSMKIPGVRRIVREMCGVVRSRRDGLTVWVNHDPPPIGKEFEDCWDLVVQGSSDDVAGFAKLRHWDDDGTGVKTCTESDAERAVRDQGIQVVIESPQQAAALAIPTPAPSPAPRSHQSQSKLSFSKLQHVAIPEKEKQPSTTTSSGRQSSKPGPIAQSKKKNPPGRPRKKPLDASDSVKINQAFKTKKPRRGAAPEVKRKPSLLSAYQDHWSMVNSQPHAAQCDGPLSNRFVRPASSDVSGCKPIVPQDLEWLGPTKITFASELPPLAPENVPAAATITTYPAA